MLNSAPAGPLLLLDAASMYFRAFYGVPAGAPAPDGTQVNAVRGFLDMVATLIRTRSAQRLVACWDDDWRPQFRTALVPSYKAHRVAEADSGAEEVPDALSPQVPLIAQVLELLGLCRLGAPGYEADDVIATLTHRAVRLRRDGVADAPVEVVTGDRDLFQLVDDENLVRVLYLGRGLRNLEIVDQAALHTKYGVSTGTAYAELALLRGDASDGLPGVSGIGEKTAAALLARFGDLRGVRAAALDPDTDLSPARRRNLVAASDYLDAAGPVVFAALDVPVPPQLRDTIPLTPPDPQALAAFAQRWGVESSLARVLQAIGASVQLG